MIHPFLIIDMGVGNAAFGESPGERDAEISRILMRLSRRFLSRRDSTVDL
jgi:hypothetical protein